MRDYLALASTVQPGLGRAGLRKAMRNRRTYDIGFLHGSPKHVRHGALLMGINLSAPVVMLTPHRVCIAQLLVRPDPRDARFLGVLGLIMTASHPAEGSAHQAWRGGDDRITLLAGAATVLAVEMAWPGLIPPPPDTPPNLARVPSESLSTARPHTGDDPAA